MPGLLAAKCGALVVFTDLPTALPRSILHARRNGVHTARFHPLIWGEIDPKFQELVESVDLIIASDIFYDSIGICLREEG